LSNNIKEKLSFCTKINLLLSFLFPFEKERMKGMSFIVIDAGGNGSSSVLWRLKTMWKKYSGGRLW